MTELTQEQRVALLRRRLELQERRRADPALSQVNLGIADSLGGLVDLINPFDTPAVSQALGMGDTLTTGSARTGMVQGMQAINAAGEDRAPEGLAENVLRGSGQAAGAAPLVGGAATVATRLPGIAGQVAQTVRGGASTVPAVAAEITAGGVSAGAMDETERRLEGSDLPQWAQDLAVNTAGVVAPMTALPAATYVGNAAARTIPQISLVNQGVRATRAAIAPYTRRGAEDIARRRVQEIAGGRERALEIGERINPNDEFGRTPAQQTGDRGMLAIEQTAASQRSTIQDQLDRQFSGSMDQARGAISEVGGDVGEGQQFFRQARAQYTTEMRAVADQAMRNAEDRLSRVEATRRPSANSQIVMEEVQRALDTARVRERELWQAVPVTRNIGTSNARAAAARIVADTGEPLQRDIPADVGRYLLDEGTAYTDGTSVRNLHALYSSLRQTAREASAGSAPNNNRARIANEVADAILEDLGAISATDEIGRTINAARAFSRSLHETFDQGAYGRLSRQTVSGDTVTDPRVALDRSVGRGGTGGMVDAENLGTAASGIGDNGAPQRPNQRAEGAIVDYVRGRFADDAFTPDASGNMVLNRRGAAQFVRNNQELLERYPALRGEILEAADQQQTADTLTAAIAQRIQSMENGRSNPVSGFADATQENAIRSIVEAENPIRAAQAIVSTARRDPTGAALEGVKASFSGELIRRATRTRDGVTFLEADAMAERMQDSRFRAAMARVLEPAEIRRLERVIDVVQSLNQSQVRQPSIGDNLSGARSPRVIQIIARMTGANVATRAQGGGNAGVSLQAANLGAGTANQMIDSLTADRASQILMDAVTDHRLMQALLMDPASPRFQREGLPRLIPYLIGTSVAVATPDE